MVLNRKQKANRNILSTSALEVVSIINGFILPKLIIETFGSSYNGIASSVTQFLQLISILTIGVGASTRVALYRSLADEDIRATSAIVRASEKYMRKVGVILAIYIVGLACIYPFVIKTGFSFLEVASLILIIGMSSFAEYFFGVTYQTFLLADQCVYISNVFTIISNLLNLVLSVILIRLGFSIQIVKLGSASVFALKPIMLGAYIRKRYGLDRHCEPDTSALKHRRDAMMHTVANIVHNNTDLVVLTIFTDVKTVSVYTVYNLVMGALSKLQSIFTTGTEPIFGNMWAKGEIHAIGKNLSVYEFFISIFSSLAFSVAYVMILPFVSLYTRNVTDVNYIRPVYAAVITMAFVILAFRTPYLCLVQGVGHYRETRAAAIWEATLNFGISVLLVLIIPVKEYKMVGVAIGTLIANLFRTIHYAVYIDNHIVRRGIHVFALRILWTIINILVIVVPCRIFIGRLSIESWISWLICTICVSVYSVIVVSLSAALCFRKDLLFSYNVFISMLKSKIRKA